MSKRVKVFTDGSSRPRTKDTSGWAFALFMSGKIHVFYGHHKAPSTNNVGELGAVLYPHRILKGANIEFDFVTDSEYVKKGLLEYRKGWESRGLRNNQGKPIKNKDMWVEMFAHWDAKKGSIEWVRGHSGEFMNEVADFWANRGADNIPPLEANADDKAIAKWWRSMAKLGIMGNGTIPGDVIHFVDFPIGHKYRTIETFKKDAHNDATKTVD